jgi:polyisoprenoid-binding protein YceI
MARGFTGKPISLPLRACCLGIAALAFAGLWLPASAGALYRIDQRNGSVEFAVSTLGMFDVEGRFARFEGELLLDIRNPEQTHIDVLLDTRAVELPMPDQVDLIRSAAYFDAAEHPQVHFVSNAIQRLSPSHYLIHGTLQIRGIAQPQDLDAMLADTQRTDASGPELADFVATAQIKRSAFGMVADRPMLSDDVRLNIRIRLAIDPANAR